MARVWTVDATFKEVESSHNEKRTNLHYLFPVLYVLKILQYDLCYQIATVIRTGNVVFEAMLTSTTRTNTIIINRNVQNNRWVARCTGNALTYIEQGGIS